MKLERLLSNDEKKIFQMGKGLFGFAVETYSITSIGDGNIAALKDPNTISIFTDFNLAEAELIKRKEDYDSYKK